ncbi:MAG: 2-oxo acid dehydrogenase subunit E2 [Gammaproteobacteria bacterium]|nr:2-oxo acid dehydrogenase subunit E2 [Gammaproteobacteria bacterium]MCP5201080.1 2-oxo acid dehydrogenase subunit E2 [Gammaproteobacteria bacterium]
MHEFRLPSLGADMESARVVEWLVAPGDTVKAGDLVAVLETDKGAIDIEIFEDAVIEALVAPLDVELPVGAVLATLRGGDDGAAATPSAMPPSATPAAPVAAAAPTPAAPPPQAPPALVPRAGTTTAPGADGFVRASPLARKQAAARAVDLATLAGSGPGGAVLAADVDGARAAATATPRPRGFDAASMRRAIGAAMSRSKREIPHYYLSQAVDLGLALTWLAEYNASVDVAKRLLPAVLLARAAARALAAHPAFNGHYVDEAFVPAAEINLGWAIALRGGGLIAPALRRADQGSLDELMAALRDLVKRARGGGLRGSELTAASVTVTSLGDRGADLVWPVIHPPQVAMIGFGGIATRPWVVDEGIAARPVVNVSLAADHRVSDGHAGSLLLEAIAAALAAPRDL